MLTATDYLAVEVEDAYVAACTANAIGGVEARARITQVVCGWHRATQGSKDLVCKRLQSFLEPIYLRRRLDEIRNDPAYPYLLDIVRNWNYTCVANKQMVYAAISHGPAPYPVTLH